MATTRVNEGSGRDQSLRHAGLDGLRGIAIALVTAYHFLRGPGGGVTDATSLVASMGWIGVDLFFVISGFLITGILLDTKRQAGYFRSFYARRVLRILPLYYGYLLLLLLLPRSGSLAAALGAPYLAEHQAWFWTHTTNWLLAASYGPGGAGAAGFGALWSLALEEQFYLFWPAVVALVSDRTIVRLCLWIVGGSLPMRLALAIGGVSPYSLYVSSFTHLDPLAVGALLAVWSRNGVLAGQTRRAWWWVMVGAVLFLTCTALLGTGAPIYGVPLSFMVSGAAVLWGGIVAVAVVAPANRWLAPISTGPLVALGKYSYAFYLLQLPVSATLRLVGLHDRLPGRYASAAAIVVVTYVAAYLSWHLWETRWLSLKTHFPRRLASDLSAP